MKAAVVGGGWAGLSAAFYLHQAGADVTVFEAARSLGGRARSVHSARLNTTIDNGQHILLGAYTETISLIKELGLEVKSVLHQTPLTLQSADGQFALRTPSLPAPFHLLAAILGARGLSLKERYQLITITRRLQDKQWITPAGLTVSRWLEQGRQSDHVIRQFWQPLCIAALNTPVDQACAQLLANVLRDSLGGPKSSSSVLIPRVDLSALWPEHLPAGIRIQRGHAVRHLTSRDTHAQVDGEEFDGVVVATNAPSAHRLLKNLGRPEKHSESADGSDFLDILTAFRYIPIATVTLALEKPWGLPLPMLMLADAPEKKQYGQWLFDRSKFMHNCATLTVVISDARTIDNVPRERVIAGILTQIQEQTQRFPSMPKVIGHELIVEKRATFAAIPNLQRPGNDTPWPRIWVAGDWTDTGYPAVLEGAVRSGKKAASLAVAQTWKEKPRPSPHDQ